MATVVEREPSLHVFNPKWPDLRTAPMQSTYDRPTDTLFVDFCREARPAASVPLDLGERDYFYLRVDPATDDVVGLQIESFLTYALGRHPKLAVLLDGASLVGATREDLRLPASSHPYDLLATGGREVLIAEVARLLL